MLLKLYHWYKKIKKFKSNSEILKNKIKYLQGRILMRKLRLAVNVKSQRESTSLDVLIQASEIV